MNASRPSPCGLLWRPDRSHPGASPWVWMVTAAGMGVLLAQGGCADRPTTSKPPVMIDDPSDHESADTDHDEVIDTSRHRPLCLEPAPPRTIAPDLVAWADSLVNSTNGFYGELEWRAYEAMGESLGPTPEVIVTNRIERGWMRLKFGDDEGAIADLSAAEALAITDVPWWRGRTRELLGAAWMRKAETDNCITSGSGHACIIPFGEEGVHADPEGMANAALSLERCLTEDFPTAISPKWLFNVTFMARGLWPDSVPRSYAFPPGFLDPEGPADAWFNHAPSLDMREATTAGSSATEDFDGDGLLDVLFSSMEPDDTMDLYLNTGDGRFCNASDASRVSSIPGLLSFSVADYDNDGDNDILGPRGAWMGGQFRVRPSLLRNDGQGHFTDVAVEAGLADPSVNGPSQVSAWADVDGDGWLDVFIGREDSDSSPYGRSPSSLYINQRDGTFVDIAVAAGVAFPGFVKGASWIDHDADGDPDLYVNPLRDENHLYENRGDLTFVDAGGRLGVQYPLKSFASAILDYDQNGLPDIFCAAFTNNFAGGGPLDPDYFQSAESYLNDKLGLPTDPKFSETAHLYRNTGEGFEDVTVAVGLDDVHATMGMSFGDLDMDGWPDLYLATGAPQYDALEPNTSYRNEAGLRFLDVTTATRLGHIQKGHGVSFGDLDEDGDQDLVVEMGGAFRGDLSPNAVFGNPTNVGAAVRRHGITLRLEGVTSNRSAIGAQVRVITPGRDFWGTVGETGSFGNNSLQLELGLDDQTTITRVEVRWPGGGLETIPVVPVDHVVLLRQGQGIAGSTPYRRLELAREEHPHG